MDENLISTLDKSLRQTRNAQNRLVARLNEVEDEAQRLRQEIEALENSAEQTEAAIYSLLATVRSGKQPWNLGKRFHVDEDYEVPAATRRPPRVTPRSQQNNHPNDYGNQNNSPQNYRNNRNNPDNYNGDNYNNDHREDNYREDKYNDNSSVAYINKHRNQSPVNQKIEPLTHRFADRTITQSCRLLLLEADEPLHVNELYTLLVQGGFEFKGNNPTISIAVSLNRNRRFKKVAPGTFDLVMREASQAAS